jgi:hypothetical protein
VVVIRTRPDTATGHRDRSVFPLIAHLRAEYPANIHSKQPQLTAGFWHIYSVFAILGSEPVSTQQIWLEATCDTSTDSGITWQAGSTNILFNADQPQKTHQSFMQGVAISMSADGAADVVPANSSSDRNQ